MRNLFRCAALFGLAQTLMSCSMVSSSLIDEVAVPTEPNAPLCESAVGSYYLPKTQILVEVKRAKDSENVYYNKVEIKRKRVPDRRFGYCLDYRRSPTSDDIVQVKKYPETQILGIVSTDALDQTSLILQTLVQSLFVAISGNPNFDKTATRRFRDTADGEVTVFKAEFDPFEPFMSARINDALNDFGFCLILEDFTFDARAQNIDSYCDNPAGALRAARERALDYKHHYDVTFADEGARQNSGLFYRPRVPYSYNLFIKRNPQISGGWQLRGSRAIRMENISPVLAIGLERAAFSQRKTTVLFNEGMLENVCVYKGSELLQAVQVPLAVAQSIVALPANIIQVRINNSNSDAELIAAEKRLLDWQRRELELEQDASLTDTSKLHRAETVPSADGKSGTGTSGFKLDKLKLSRGEASFEDPPVGVTNPDGQFSETVSENAKAQWKTTCPPTDLTKTYSAIATGDIAPGPE